MNTHSCPQFFPNIFLNFTDFPISASCLFLLLALSSPHVQILEQAEVGSYPKSYYVDYRREKI